MADPTPPERDTNSPTPSERERNDAEQKQREEAEQAALPYKWTQTIGDVDISVPVPGNLRGRDIEVVLKKRSIRVAVKGEEAIIDVGLILSSLAWLHIGFMSNQLLLASQSSLVELVNGNQHLFSFNQDSLQFGNLFG